ncbi:MAG: hypothetical protein RMJ83_10200, partial [Armatimonadota bacterium]|nr:hypothetical protein [Armatimonadota bacterium]
MQQASQCVSAVRPDTPQSLEDHVNAGVHRTTGAKQLARVALTNRQTLRPQRALPSEPTGIIPHAMRKHRRKPFQRYFTVAEANALLPELRVKLLRLQAML